MKMTCPSCGASLSADAAGNDYEARQCLATIAQMPEAIARFAFAYLSLFRSSGGRGLRWSRARRLAGEVHRLVLAGEVAKGQLAARPCPPALWRKGMEQVVDHPPTRLPLKSHNYLLAVVYDLADAADRVQEKTAEQQLQQRRRQETATRPAGKEDLIGPEDFAAIRARLGMRPPKKETGGDNGV